MYYDTANEPLEYLGVPPPPPAALRVEKSESVSSEDEFECDEDNLALLRVAMLNARLVILLWNIVYSSNV
jgi:hypothetical protein